MFEKNTKQVNRTIAKMFAMCLSAVLIMAALSFLGFFEFGTTYTLIVLIAGIVVTISPTVLIKFLSDDFMKYYMLIMLSLFIGVLGTSNHIGIYMTYALAPLFSCLYFNPKFTANKNEHLFLHSHGSSTVFQLQREIRGSVSGQISHCDLCSLPHRLYYRICRCE